MGPDYRKRLSVSDMSKGCRDIAPCSNRCLNSCFGPDADQCQTSKKQSANRSEALCNYSLPTDVHLVRQWNVLFRRLQFDAML